MSSKLFRSAAHLKASARSKKRPALLFLTDPARTPDPIASLQALPRGVGRGLGVVYRHFGASDRVRVARRLRKLCARRGWMLLIGADPGLAARVGADGVHLPERRARRAAVLKRRRPTWIVTAATHSAATASRIRGVDAILVSPAFPTLSISAKGKKPLRRRGLAQIAARAKMPVYALGGINNRTIKLLENIRNVSGAAMIDGLLWPEA